MFGRKKAENPPPITDLEPRVVKFLPRNPTNPESTSKMVSSPSADCLHTIKQSKNKITPDYAYDLLMAEIQLETTDKASKETVQKLFELYKIGIEYYNLKQDNLKEGYFKKKLDSLSMHPAVLGMLHQQKHNDDNFYKKKQIERLVEINNKDTLNDVDSMIRKIERVEEGTRNTVEKCLKRQHEDIKSRIEKRKKNLKPVSVSDMRIPGEAEETEQLSSPVERQKTKQQAASTSKKGSLSFASPEQQDDYAKYFVDGKYAQC